MTASKGTRGGGARGRKVAVKTADTAVTQATRHRAIDAQEAGILVERIDRLQAMMDEIERLVKGMAAERGLRV